MPIYTSHVSASTAVTSSLYKVDSSLLPDANDGASIGAATNAFSDLFLAEGGVINWDNGDATLTQAGNVVTLAGATFAGTISTAAQPNITSVGTLSGLDVSTNPSTVYIDINPTSQTINGVSIGGTTPAAGAFTTLSSTGNTTIGNASGDSLTINAQSITAPNMTSGTSNSVLVKGTVGDLYTDEIDPRVWGTTLLDGSNGTNNEIAIFTDANSVEGDAKVTWDGAIFAVDGDISANQYIVSSSITYMTQSFSSGSTIFGDTLDDRHEFTGSLFTKGTGSFDNGINATVLTAAQPAITSLGTLTGLTVHGNATIGNSGDPGVHTINGQLKNFSKASGSAVSTGSFGHVVATTLKGDGSQITGLTSAAIDTTAGMTNNYILTATGATAVTGESNLTFDGSVLTVTGTIAGSAIKDEDNMASDSATHLASQQSIKAYVDTQVTAQDLDITDDVSQTISIDLDSEALSIAGGTGISTAGSGNEITITAATAAANAAGIVELATNAETITGTDAGRAVTPDGLNARIAEGAAGNISGSSTSTGSFGMLIGDGAGITNLTAAAISSYTNSGNNRVVTSVDGSTVNGEANLTFDGSTLTVTGTITGSAVKDEDNMSSNSATALATQQSIKAYVDAQVTAQDMDVASDSGTIDVDLDSETLTIAGGDGIDTSASGTTVTIAAEEGTALNAGAVIVAGGTNATVGYADGTATVNVDDAFLKNNANDSTSGTITAAGFIATGNVSGSSTSTASFGHIFTAGGGVTAGTILPDSDNAYDLGSASKRFANLYVGDLMMSNKSRGGNEVDGTYGDYTIQAGEEDLYLLNHRNGKTYRFKLEEVDSRPWYKKIFS